MTWKRSLSTTADPSTELLMLLVAHQLDCVQHIKDLIQPSLIDAPLMQVSLMASVGSDACKLAARTARFDPAVTKPGPALAGAGSGGGGRMVLGGEIASA